MGAVALCALRLRAGISRYPDELCDCLAHSPRIVELTLQIEMPRPEPKVRVLGPNNGYCNDDCKPSTTLYPCLLVRGLKEFLSGQW